MTGWSGLVAAGRACLAMEGADAAAVLQGVVTNDVSAVPPDRAVYAALLTPQGKYLFDFFVSLRPGGGYRIEVAADRAEALAKRLSMYALRRDARVSPEPGIGVLLAFGEGAPPPAPEGAVALPDPRDPRLGLRILCHDPAAALAAMGLAHATEEDLAALRIALGVPETGVELVPEETFILEAGFERLHGVDFRKGCYVGQEVTARMKHKAELRKGLVRVAVEGAAEPGTPVVTAEGKPAGTLYSQARGMGLAHLRFDRTGGPLTAGEARVLPEG